MDDSIRDRIRSYVEEHAAEQLEFTIGLCNQNSYTYNKRGTERVAEMLLDRLAGLLPHEEMVRQDEVGDHRILRTRPVSNGIYLLGHTDTVFPPDHPFQECETYGEWLAGPGVGDMKGGLAVLVYALLALGDSGVLDSLDVTLILGADEETGAVTSRDIYERERVNATACLVTECAGPGGEVVMSRNGKAGIRIECSGEAKHVGRVSDGKRSAVVEMAHKILALEALNGCCPGVTVNVGKLEGGLGPCTVPGQAHALIDVRWLEEKHFDVVLAKVRGIAERSTCPGCSCDMEVLNHRPAMPTTEGSEALYGTLTKVARSVSATVGREHRSGTSDANYFGSAGVPTLDGLGPVCHDDHTLKERILIPSLSGRTTLLALLLAELRQ
jgi:glutamate carboxypeptidase